MGKKQQPEKLEPTMAVVFRADKIVVRGADVDGGYTVTLKCGADQQTKMAYLMAIPQNQNVTVAVAPFKRRDDDMAKKDVVKNLECGCVFQNGEQIEWCNYHQLGREENEVGDNEMSKMSNLLSKVNVPDRPYNEEEFEMFLNFLGNKQIGHWQAIATALGVSEKTIKRWREHPKAKAARLLAIAKALEGMENAGRNDWRMWKDQLAILGIQAKELMELTGANGESLNANSGLSEIATALNAIANPKRDAGNGEGDNS